jgi:hypothetical protein
MAQTGSQAAVYAKELILTQIITEIFWGSNWAELCLIHVAAIFWIKKIFGSRKDKRN